MNEATRTYKNLEKNTPKNKKSEEDAVDQTLKDTFPASDPPSWYGGEDKENE